MAIAGITLLAGWLVPGSVPDRALFRAVVRGAYNPPYWIEGFGSRLTPWSVRSLAKDVHPQGNHVPVMVGVGDDPEGVFQSVPPSPIDFAVMFSNLSRLGVRRAACAVVLAWEKPDAIGLAALERSWKGFESLAMAAPVSRGAVAQPLPPAFRRASLPVKAVMGNTGSLPAVNRIPVADVLLERDHALAGFSVIESEDDGGKPYLCARWDDRIVFSFAVCAVMQRVGVPVDAMDVRLGEFIRFGKGGPMVPIDASGRLAVAAVRTKSGILAAEDLIDARRGWIPLSAPEPVILADRRGQVDDSTRRFTDQLPGLVATIGSGGGLAAVREVPRPSWVVEWIVLAAGAFAFVSVPGLPRFGGWIVWGGMGAAVVILQSLSFSVGSLWMPGASLLIGWFFTGLVLARPARDPVA